VSWFEFLESVELSGLVELVACSLSEVEFVNFTQLGNSKLCFLIWRGCKKAVGVAEPKSKKKK